VGDIITCFLNNPDVIALWLSFIPTFSIFSLLFNNNDQEGYISNDIESNSEKLNGVHDLPNFFKSFSSKSSSSLRSSSSSSSSCSLRSS
jgi:hypothetical protein